MTSQLSESNCDDAQVAHCFTACAWLKNSKIQKATTVSYFQSWSKAANLQTSPTQANNCNMLSCIPLPSFLGTHLVAPMPCMGGCTMYAMALKVMWISAHRIQCTGVKKHPPKTGAMHWMQSWSSKILLWQFSVTVLQLCCNVDNSHQDFRVCNPFAVAVTFLDYSVWNHDEQFGLTEATANSNSYSAGMWIALGSCFRAGCGWLLGRCVTLDVVTFS